MLDARSISKRDTYESSKMDGRMHRLSKQYMNMDHHDGIDTENMNCKSLSSSRFVLNQLNRL